MAGKKITILIIISTLTTTLVGCQLLPRQRDNKESFLMREISLKKEQASSRTMAQFYFEEGMKYYSKEEMDKAIPCFAEALKIDPEHPKARQMFEETLKKVTPEESKPLIEKEKVESLPEELPKETPLEEKGLPSEEEKEIPKEKLSPPEEERKKKIKVEEVSEEELRWFEFAKDLKKRGIYDEAIKEFNGLLDEFPGTTLSDRVVYLRAETQFAKGGYPEAEKDYLSLIEDYPESPFVDNVRLRIADTYFARAEYDQALIRYLRLAREFKDRAMKTLPEEERKGEIAPLPQPKSFLAAKAQLGLADSYRLKEDYPNALIEYYEVIKSHTERSSRGQALYYIGYIYDFIEKVRDYKRAVAAYERVIKDHPESSWASYAQERKKYIENNYLK